MRRNKSSQVDQHADEVVLRRWRRGGGVVALFPDMLAADGLVTAYQHVGQHGAADYQHVIGQTVPVPVAEPDQERDELLDELRSIGYNPVVKQRRKRQRR